MKYGCLGVFVPKEAFYAHLLTGMEIGTTDSVITTYAYNLVQYSSLPVELVCDPSAPSRLDL